MRSASPTGSVSLGHHQVGTTERPDPTGARKQTAPHYIHANTSDCSGHQPYVIFVAPEDSGARFNYTLSQGSV